jgi:LPS export ABC transporter protein LptC
MRRFKIIGIVGVSLLFLLGLYWLWGDAAQEGGAARPLSREMNADVALDGVEMRLGQAGRTLWELKAISATYNQEKQLVLLNAPSIVKHLSKQDLPIQVDAPQGEVNQSSNDIRLWSGVHMQYGPMSLTSDEAVYIQVDETIYLHGDVLLNRQGMQLRAPKGNVHLPTWVVNATGGVEVIIAKDRLTGSF